MNRDSGFLMESILNDDVSIIEMMTKLDYYVNSVASVRFERSYYSGFERNFTVGKMLSTISHAKEKSKKGRVIDAVNFIF